MITFVHRSHSSPLIDAPKIKTEVEDDIAVEAPPALEVPPVDIVIKEEVEPPEELVAEDDEDKEHGIVGGLGLLCDVAHRFIEEEAGTSRPESPCDEQDNKSTGTYIVTISLC